jgi:hypothetical protein
LVSQQAGSQTLVWRGYASEASPNTIVSRDSQGSSQFYDVGLSGNLYVSGTITCENTLYVSPLGIGFANGTIQTVAGITSLTGDVTATPASNGSASATVARIRGINVSATVPVNGQVLKYNGTQWAPSADTDAGITALTGDVIASGSGSVVATLANTGVVAASYGSASSVPAFSVDAKGRITSASNQTITPAAIGAMPVFSTLGIALGGTGATTQQAALNALAGAVTSGQYLRGTGANVVLSAIQASDVPTLNQNTTGTASNVTGVVAVANGGTGATTLTGIIKGNGTGAFTAAVAGTDYLAAGTAVLKTGDTMSGALTVSTTGTGTSLTVSNAATATSDCVVITNQGTGRSLIVNDVSGDATPFVIDASGRVGIGVATSTFALDVYNKNQTTDGVARFSYDIAGARTSALEIASNGDIRTFGTFISNGLVAVSAQGIYFDLDGNTQTKAGITSLTGDVTASAGDATASVVRIQGRSVASTAPTSGQVLAWNGSAWAPTSPTGGGSVTSITAGSGLTGGTITTSGTINVNFGSSAGTVTQGGTTVLKSGDTMSGALTISTTGTGASLAISNASTATSDCVTITNQGTGKSFVVNDVSGDLTPFVIHASGEVAIGSALTDTPSASFSIKRTSIPVIKIISATGATGNLIDYRHNTSTLRDLIVTGDSEITCYSVTAYNLIALGNISADGNFIISTDGNGISFANGSSITSGFLNGSVSYTQTISTNTQATATVTVTGAALGDFALASLSVSAAGLIVTAYVSATNTVTVLMRNETGASITLSGATIKVKVTK